MGAGARGEGRIRGLGAQLRLDQLGAKLTRLTPKRVEYIGIPVDGPYKTDHYRY
jgi:adenosylhomocysteinase